MVFVDQVAGPCVWSIPGTKTAGRMLEGMRAMGLPVFADVDDNYTVMYDGEGDPGWERQLNEEDHPSITAHRLIVQHQASGVICSTEPLARSYRRLHDNVHVVPNTVDPRDWPGDPVAEGTGKVRVGFAGSVNHMEGLRLVTKALRWVSEQPGMEVVILGHGRREWDFPHLHIPWSESLSDYRLDLCQLDIGLAPLVETSWLIGKSDLKVLEYAMAGAFPVVSDVEPFSAWRGTVETAVTANDFLHQVQELAADIGATRERARALRDTVISDRSASSNAWRYEEVFGSAQ